MKSETSCHVPYDHILREQFGAGLEGDYLDTTLLISITHC